LAGGWHLALRRFAISTHSSNGTAQAFSVSLTAYPVSLLVLDARRVAFDPDTERYAQVQSFLVGQAELSS
jgi:hypothetical protein